MNNQDVIINLQKNAKNIRNLCILAHVDHGKTTLADTLLSSNGIISTKMAGKLRYMDSRKDEQERGITMKSSAVSLIHEYKKDHLFLINLIDSPGHVDFSTEVSTAVRLCDGAILIVDVCEGICPQTHAVLRQAWLEKIKLILVLNKIDRLILELKMTPEDAYVHMRQILEQLNAIVAQQFASLLFEKGDISRSEAKPDEIVPDEEWQENVDESKLYFSPEYNNVIFSSAIDGWGFSINDFANIYSNKLGIKLEVLKKTLWGDFYINTKTKRVMRGAKNQGKKNLFVQLVLDNIWTIYENLYVKRDNQMVEKIINALNIKIPPRDLKQTDSRAPLQTLFTNWLPLSKSLLDMVVEYLPSPTELADEKVEHLLCTNSAKFKNLPEKTQQLKEDFLNCDANKSKSVVVYISKMFFAEKSSINKNKRKQLSLEDIAKRRELIKQKKAEAALQQTTASETGDHGACQLNLTEKKTEIETPEVKEPDYEFLAFARVFSGTIRKDQTLFILTPKHNPHDFVGHNLEITSSIDEIHAVSKHVTKFKVQELYLMMGRELEMMEEVPCGNILAIGGLEGLVLRSATISDTLYCPSFTDMYTQTTPIVRVAIEPKHPAHMKELTEGLKLLNQADPCVEIKLESNGEQILCAAGEVHLQRCIDDLVQQFAKVEVNVSTPRIPYRETIILPPKFDLVKEKITQATQTDAKIELKSIDKKYSIALRARPLPSNVTKFIEKHSQLIKILNHFNENLIPITPELVNNLKEFKNNLIAEFKGSEEDKWDESVVNNIWAFGPNRIGPNLLINCDDNYKKFSIWSPIEHSEQPEQNKIKLYRFKELNDLILGFQLVAHGGPLCKEPLMGVSFLIEKFEIKTNETTVEANEEENVEDEEAKSDEKSETGSEQMEKEEKVIKRVQAKTNQIIPLMKDACKKAFEAQPQRLMRAMYKCLIMSNAEALGKLYAVLSKRNGRVVEENLKEGSTMFIIDAFLPVAESFGFAEELRKKTGGLASLHLEFSHYETIDMDPFWEPKTEEEYLLYGDKADFENLALKHVNEIRKRKGLFTKEKIVEHSEKQRTLTIK